MKEAVAQRVLEAVLRPLLSVPVFGRTPGGRGRQAGRDPLQRERKKTPIENMMRKMRMQSARIETP